MAAFEAHPRPSEEHGSEASSRPLKFPDTLKELLVGKNHALTARSVGISRSALSQYLTGRSQPSLGTLRELARVLDVTLDYLLYGQEVVQRESLEPSRMGLYFETALERVERRAADRASLAGRISEILSSQIAAAAETALANLPGGAVSGVLRDADTLILEYHSLSSRVVSMLDDDVIKVGGDVAAEGRFTRVVAQNIRASREYRFLLPARLKLWRDSVADCRQALRQVDVRQQDLDERCQFRETDSFLPIGFAIYQLDLDGFRRNDPLVFREFSTLLPPDGLVGYVIPPMRSVQLFPLMDEEHLHYAVKEFDRLWEAEETRSL